MYRHSLGFTFGPTLSQSTSRVALWSKLCLVADIYLAPSCPGCSTNYKQKQCEHVHCRLPDMAVGDDLGRVDTRVMTSSRCSQIQRCHACMWTAECT